MTGKVAVITGGSQGIGAGLVAGYRHRGWAVASALTMLSQTRERAARH
jgi:NAD(P)-dependent dehydrogenase (short-subunit alcohol dehydrogenase family)